MLLFAEYLGTAYYHIINIAAKAEKDTTQVVICKQPFCVFTDGVMWLRYSKSLFVVTLHTIYNAAHKDKLLSSLLTLSSQAEAFSFLRRC